MEIWLKRVPKTKGDVFYTCTSLQCNYHELRRLIQGTLTNACSSLVTATIVGELADVSDDEICVFRYSMIEATLHISGIKMGSEDDVGTSVDEACDCPSFSRDGTLGVANAA